MLHTTLPVDVRCTSTASNASPPGSSLPPIVAVPESEAATSMLPSPSVARSGDVNVPTSAWLQRGAPSAVNEATARSCAPMLESGAPPKSISPTSADATITPPESSSASASIAWPFASPNALLHVAAAPHGAIWPVHSSSAGVEQSSIAGNTSPLQALHVAPRTSHVWIPARHEPTPSVPAGPL